MNTAGLPLLDRLSRSSVVLRDDTYHNRWASSAALKLADVQAIRRSDHGEIGRDLRAERDRDLIRPPRAWWTGARRRSLPQNGSRRERLDLGAERPWCHRLHRRRQHAADHGSAEGARRSGELTAWRSLCDPVVEPGFMFGKASEAVCARIIAAPMKPDYVKVFLDGVTT